MKEAEKRLIEIKKEQKELMEKISRLNTEEWNLMSDVNSYYIGIIDDPEWLTELYLLGWRSKEEAIKWLNENGDNDTVTCVFEVSEKEYKEYCNAWNVCKAKQLIEFIDEDIYHELEERLDTMVEQLEHYFSFASELE